MKKNKCIGLLNYRTENINQKIFRVITAFDIDERKVEKDVSEATFEKPNNTKIFYENVPRIGTKVLRSPTFDGFPKHMDKYYENIK